MAILIALAFLLVGCPLSWAQQPQSNKAENVIVVTLDGFRWQEFFRGADETLMDKKSGGVPDVEGLRAAFWRDTAEARRSVLLPFIWGIMAKEGQIFGDPGKNAAARITNGLKFSYPGYSEMFCGFADDRVDANARKNNPNANVLEYLDSRPGFRGRVAAYCTWDIFPYIFRSSQNRLKVVSGWKPGFSGQLSDRQRYLQRLMDRMPRYWADNAFDVFTMEFAEEELQIRKPRVLYIGLGETDEWGHGRRYDLYLKSAQNADRYLAQLWQQLQADPAYAGKTALIVTCDHGRGNTRIDWTDHGKDVPLAEYIWIAAMGPGIPALGVRQNVQARQAQVAATIAELVGENFATTHPKIARPLPLQDQVFGQGDGQHAGGVKENVQGDGRNQ